MNRKYTLIENFEVLVKREIRKKVNQIDDIKRVVIHASYNDIESAIFFNCAFEKKLIMNCASYNYCLDSVSNKARTDRVLFFMNQRSPY